MSELPNGWAATTLQEITAPRGEKADPASLDDVPFIGMDHIEAHTSRLLSSQSVKELKSAVAVFKAGDILYGRLRPYLNKVHQAQFDGTASAEFIVIPPSPVIEQRYLAHLMRSPSFIALANQRSTGDRPRVTFENVGDFPIELPPLPEQRRIVAKLDQLFERTTSAREELANIPTLIEHYKQSILRKAFSGELTLGWRSSAADENDANFYIAERQRVAEEIQKSSGIGRDIRASMLKPDESLLCDIQDRKSRTELPSSWAWAAVGQVFGVFVGATPSRKKEEYWNGSIPWVSSGEVSFRRIAHTKETITDSGLANTSTRLHPPGTVLLGMIGEGKTRGQVAVLDVAACNNQNCAAIRVSEGGYSPEYLYWYFLYVYKKTRTIGSGNGPQALNKDRVQRLLIPLAPPEEAAEIARIISESFIAIDCLEREWRHSSRLLGKLQRSIFSKAFRGELVRQDPNDEPADALLQRIRSEGCSRTPARRGRRAKAGA